MDGSGINGYVPIVEAARFFPAVDGRPVPKASLYRWCRAGWHGARLQHVRLGARIFTRPEWCEAFMAACAEAGLSAEARATELWARAQAASLNTDAWDAHVEQSRRQLAALGVRMGPDGAGRNAGTEPRGPRRNAGTGQPEAGKRWR